MGCNGAPSRSLASITLTLINAGFSPRVLSSQSGSWPGWNAMHWAAAGPFLEIVEHLHNKDPELLHLPTSNESAESPLHIAALASYGLDMVQLLLRLGADPCKLSGYGITPLAHCIGESRLQLDMKKFELLLAANAVNGCIVDKHGSNILHFIALRAAKLDQESLPGHELLRYVLNRPDLRKLINSTNERGITPLHLVCFRPDYASIRLLVEAGADLHCMTSEPNAMSPLGLVLEHARAPEEGFAGKDLDSIWHRFAYTAACYLSECTKGTPSDKRLAKLHIAAYCGYLEEVKRLVEQDGADIEARNARGFTPLEMLAGLLIRHSQLRAPIDARYLRRAQDILEYLESIRQSTITNSA